ncbi:MAG: hypothetical protein ACREQQ_14130 [Candidatus Binatia bacterium]
MSPTTDRWKLLLWPLALLNVLNGVWMLADPGGWYHGIPAGVPDTGPLNPHFVRDIGAVFVMMGVALHWAAIRPAYRIPLVGVVVLWSGLHALVHAWETFGGTLPAHHWAMDFPAVYLPAALLAAMLVVLARQPQTSSRRT